jgi:hypothetical protein
LSEVKSEKRERKNTPEDFREILTLFSEKVPGLVKNLVTSVFSEEAARSMGKAAATYYQELKAGGIPDSVAVQMTKEYIGTFSKMSEMFRGATGGSRRGLQAPTDKPREASDEE